MIRGVLKELLAHKSKKVYALYKLFHHGALNGGCQTRRTHKMGLLHLSANIILELSRNREQRAFSFSTTSESFEKSRYGIMISNQAFLLMY